MNAFRNNEKLSVLQYLPDKSDRPVSLPWASADHMQKGVFIYKTLAGAYWDSFLAREPLFQSQLFLFSLSCVASVQSEYEAGLGHGMWLAHLLPHRAGASWRPAERDTPLGGG